MKNIAIPDLAAGIRWEEVRHAWATKHGRRAIAADAAMRQRCLAQRLGDATGVFPRRLEP